MRACVHACACLHSCTVKQLTRRPPSGSAGRACCCPAFYSVLFFIQPGTPPQEMVPPTFRVILPPRLTQSTNSFTDPFRTLSCQCIFFSLENGVGNINHHTGKIFCAQNCIIFSPEGSTKRAQRKRWGSHVVEPSRGEWGLPVTFRGCRTAGSGLLILVSFKVYM